jgi:hypothetical protein
MNATKRYTREPACQSAFTLLLDKFYDLEKNRTGTVPKPGDSVSEGTMMFIAKVLSVEYRDTIRNCFAMSLQIYAKTKTDWAGFPNDEERFISFLFNMLEHSFQIRKNTEDMIIYSEKTDWINYAKALGALT